MTGLWALHDAAAKAGPELHPTLVISTADVTRVLEDTKALSGEGDDLAEVTETYARSLSPVRADCNEWVQLTTLAAVLTRLWRFQRRIVRDSPSAERT